jgi:hypothetical protein
VSPLHHFLIDFIFARLHLSLELLADDRVFSRVVSDGEEVCLRVKSTILHRVVAFLVVPCVLVVVLQALVHVKGIAVQITNVFGAVHDWSRSSERLTNHFTLVAVVVVQD